MAGWTPPAGDADWTPPAGDRDAPEDDSPEAAEVNALAGGSEAVANAVTGIAGQAVGGLGYLGKSITNAVGLTSGDPLEVARGISDKLTYEPRSDQGKRVAEVGGKVLNAPEPYIEKAEDYLDPSGNLKTTANDVAERGNYALGAAQAVAPLLHVPEVVPGPAKLAERTKAPLPEAPTPEERIAAIKAQPDPLASAPQQKVPGKPHYAPKAGEAAPVAEATPAAKSAPGAAPEAPTRFTAPAREGQMTGSADEASQAERTNVLHDLNDLTGGALPEVRTSAITGDVAETGTDFQHSRMTDEAGIRMKGVIANESNAVQTGAENTAERSGSQVSGSDEIANQQRGRTIDRALQGIKTWFDNPDPNNPGIIQRVYRQAMQNAAGQPVPRFTQTGALLGDASQFAGTAEGEALHRGAIARAKTLGLIGEDGVWKPASVEQAERFRQWVNDQYTPRTGKMISQLKDAIDEDVAAHGGPGLLQQARFLRRRYAQMLQEPQGIADALDKDGINRKVAVKDLPEHIASLDPEQFKHVIDVMKSAIRNGMGNEADIDAALSEIKGHIANRLLDAGRKDQSGIWNPQSFYKEANRYSLNMPEIFSPEEMKAWGTVNRAGNILRMDKSYPGAAAQQHNTGIAPKLVKGATKLASLGATGAALGSEGGVAGLAVHSLGKGLERGVEKFTEGRNAKARMNEVESRITQLGERPTPPEGSAPTPTGRGSPGGVSSGTRPLGARRPGERGAVGDLGKQRGFVRTPEPLTNNASGESSASVEAQNRVAQEKANGQGRYQIDPDGNVTPLHGVDAVDARAPQGHLIVQRGVGASNYSILDRGGLPQGAAHGLLARAVGLGKLDNRPLGARIGGGNQRGAVGDLGKKPGTYPLAPAGERYTETGSRPIEQMTPDEFLSRARPLKLDEASRDNIDDLKRHIQSGGKLDPLHLLPDGKEDGRHRAYAAKELGIPQVPVVNFRGSAGSSAADVYGKAAQGPQAAELSKTVNPAKPAAAEAASAALTDAHAKAAKSIVASNELRGARTDVISQLKEAADKNADPAKSMGPSIDTATPGKSPTVQLTDAFNRALDKHNNLPLPEKVANSKAARASVRQYVKGDLITQNGKLMKQGEANVQTWGLALSPDYVEGRFMACPNSGACRDLCLGYTSGQFHAGGGGIDLTAFNGPRRAALNRTFAMLHDPEAFAVRLNDEITAAKYKAAADGDKLGLRLNVLSDLNPMIYKSLIEAHPDVQFYDYTKMPYKPVADNHHYTRSSTGVSQPAGLNDNDTDVFNPHQNWTGKSGMRARLDAGDNVAMAFTHNRHLPTTLHDAETGKTYTVVNGDEHDFRPLDKQPAGQPGVIIGLKNKKVAGAKQTSHIDANGFFVHYDPKEQRTPKGTLLRDANGDTTATNKTVTIAPQYGGMKPMTDNDLQQLAEKK